MYQVSEREQKLEQKSVRYNFLLGNFRDFALTLQVPRIQMLYFLSYAQNEPSISSSLVLNTWPVSFDLHVSLHSRSAAKVERKMSYIFAQTDIILGLSQEGKRKL